MLIDFGAARTTSQGRTITFTQIFSEGYAPIEQFAGTRQGPFSDVYALGATLYRAIGGTAVDSFTRHQALLRGQRDPQPPAAQIGGGRYDERLLGAIDAAMVVSPEERPQSVGALLALLGDTPEVDPTIVVPRGAPASAAPRLDADRDKAEKAERASAEGLAEHGLRARVDEARRQRAEADAKSRPVQAEHAAAPEGQLRKGRKLWAAIAGASLMLALATSALLYFGCREPA